MLEKPMRKVLVVEDDLGLQRQLKWAYEDFEVYCAANRAEAMAILRKQANFIRQFPEVRFRVYGHTDLVGGDEFNLKWSDIFAHTFFNFTRKWRNSMFF